MKTLTENSILAVNLTAAMRESKVSPRALAEACDVTEQAVSGWKKTGKIAKKHLPKIAQITGWSVMRLLTGNKDLRVDPRGPSPSIDDLSPIERSMLVEFRALLPEQQQHFLLELREAATKNRRLYEALREKYGLPPVAADDKVAKHIGPAPKIKHQQ